MKLTTTRKITNSAGEQVTVTFTVDFTNSSKEEMANWALSNRVIVGQKVWRDLSKAEIDSHVNGKTFNAKTIGQSIISRDKQVKKLTDNLGVSQKVAELILDNPDQLEKLIDNKNNKNNK